MDKNRFPKIDDIDRRHCNSQNVKSKWPEFYEYLMSCGYPDNLKMSERLYWYFHDLNDYPKCPICGKPTSYINFKKGCDKKGKIRYIYGRRGNYLFLMFFHHFKTKRRLSNEKET